MSELFTMWRSTRMVVLTAITAALYAAALVAFKFLTILPGVTEFRPGVALVVLCSLLFGPAAAWGAAIGNIIGDLAGGLGPGTAIGFLANFFFGLFPYRLARAFGTAEDPVPRDLKTAAAFAACAIAGSAACAIVVGAGIQALGLWPMAYKVLTSVILLTNSVVTIGLTPWLLRAIYPRVRALGLRYQDVLDIPPPATGARPAVTGAAALASLATALVLGYLASFGWIALCPPPAAGSPDAGIALATAPALLAALAALRATR